MVRPLALTLALLLSLLALGPWRRPSVHAEAREPLLVIIASATQLSTRE